MAVNSRTISTNTTIPAPISYLASATDKVTTDANNVNNLQYSGVHCLDNWGAPPTTGTIEPILIDGETGINPYNTGGGQLAYTYLFIAGATVLVKVLGIQFLALTGSTYTYLIQTDTDCSSLAATATAFDIVFGKLVGYSFEVVSGTPNINGVTYSAGDFGGEPQLAPQENRNGFWPAIYVGGSGSSIIVVENS